MIEIQRNLVIRANKWERKELPKKLVWLQTCAIFCSSHTGSHTVDRSREWAWMTLKSALEPEKSFVPPLID